MEANANKKSHTLVNLLYKFIADHGVSKAIKIDEGGELCNELNDVVCEEYGIERRIASPYYTKARV